MFIVCGVDKDLKPTAETGEKWLFRRASSAVAWAFEGEGPESLPDQMDALEDLLRYGRVDLGSLSVERMEVL